MAGKRGGAFYVISFMAVLTIVSITLVSVVYLLTEDTIRLNEFALMKVKVISSAGIEVPKDRTEIDRIYSEYIIEKRDMEGNIAHYEVYYPDRADRELKGFVIFVRGKGLWGLIDAFVGIERDGVTFLGIDFLSQNETPGLGARITEDWFTSQFRGKKAEMESVPEGQDTSENQFQAVTGATFTTNTIKYIVNKAVNDLSKVRESKEYQD